MCVCVCACVCVCVCVCVCESVCVRAHMCGHEHAKRVFDRSQNLEGVWC